MYLESTWTPKSFRAPEEFSYNPTNGLLNCRRRKNSDSNNEANPPFPAISVRTSRNFTNKE